MAVGDSPLLRLVRAYPPAAAAQQSSVRPTEIMDSPALWNTRHPSRNAWIIFWVGIGFAPIAWIVWTSRVGASWWMAYHNGGGVGHSADRVKGILCIIGMVLCMAGPFFSAAPLRRKLLFSFLAAVAGFAANYLCGVVTILFVLGV